MEESEIQASVFFTSLRWFSWIAKVKNWHLTFFKWCIILFKKYTFTHTQMRYIYFDSFFSFLKHRAVFCIALFPEQYDLESSCDTLCISHTPRLSCHLLNVIDVVGLKEKLQLSNFSSKIYFLNIKVRHSKHICINLKVKNFGVSWAHTWLGVCMLLHDSHLLTSMMCDFHLITSPWHVSWVLNVTWNFVCKKMKIA